MIWYLRSRSWLVAIVWLGAALATGSARIESVQAVDASAGSWVYEVVITGEASGNPFQRLGYVVISPTITSVTNNDVNPRDVWLTSGRPVTSPELGAISLGSNSAFLGSRAMLDVAWVQYDSSSRTFGVWPAQSLAGVGINVFNSSSGILGSLYQIYDGYMTLSFDERFRSVTGVVNIVGKGAYYYTEVIYQAIVEGRYVGTI